MERDQAHRTNELLERIAKALEKNTANVVYNGELKNTKDIPGFEGTLDALDNLTNLDKEYECCDDDTPCSCKEDDDVHNDYLNDLVQGMNQIEYLQFHSSMSFSFASNDANEMSNAIYQLEYEECLGAIKTALFIKGDSDYIESVECSGFDKERKDELARDYVKDRLDGYDNLNTPTSDNPDPAGYGNKDPYTYETNLQGIRVDSDHDIRSTASFYEIEYIEKHGATKKDCILDYVTNEFGLHGARYTDVIKFCYYLGAHNAPKYDATRDRGYYSCAFATRFGGHLVQGGKNQLVKGINKEGKERYFALSEVDNFTAYYKRIQ